MNPKSKSALSDKLKARAPLRLDAYIEASLWDPDAGYYNRDAVFGAGGDFVTSPEISQIFGEVIGLWAVQTWQDMGAPERFTLLEMGAGRGVLMRDLLRVTSKHQGFSQAMVLHILEKSEARRAEQRDAINQPITFLNTLNLPPAPAIIISNEFFDALPIRQFRNEGGGWLEAYVDENLRPTWLPCPQLPKALEPYWDADGVVELNESAIAIATHLASHLRQYGGAMLTIDYGDFDGTGDTFQALSQHRTVDPFDEPGQADLTAHVRFRDLAEAAELDTNFMTQAEFLNHWGGQARLEALKSANPALAENLQAGYDRLAETHQMGTLFKVLIQKAYS